MSTEEYHAACKAEIRKAEEACGKDAPQAQLVGHLAGEVVRLRAANESLNTQLAKHDL